MSQRPYYILPLIVVSQFAGTSLWFAGNAILPDIQQQLLLGKAALGDITSAVQLGFITGTLLFAIASVADRFSPSKVFFVSSLLAALSNCCVAWLVTDHFSLVGFRFMTGFFLAGIYPVGMKIAADWYEKGLGKALGFLVGALVLGTAFPYLLKAISLKLSWQTILFFTSAFAVLGGSLIFLFVKDGPYRKKSPGFHPKNITHIFRSKDFRSAAFGYFGHMWELYAFWAFVPVMLALNNHGNGETINIPLWSFVIISAGALSCVAGGYIAQKKGSARVAFYALAISGLCCFLSYWLLEAPTLIFLPFMILWGITVIADSPQFSALVAGTAPPEYKGTALTIVTCIGFAITIGSIQLLNFLFDHSSTGGHLFLMLGAGPLLGLIFLYRLLRSNK